MFPRKSKRAVSTEVQQYELKYYMKSKSKRNHVIAQSNELHCVIKSPARLKPGSPIDPKILRDELRIVQLENKFRSDDQSSVKTLENEMSGNISRISSILNKSGSNCRSSYLVSPGGHIGRTRNEANPHGIEGKTFSKVSHDVTFNLPRDARVIEELTRKALYTHKIWNHPKWDEHFMNAGYLSHGRSRPCRSIWSANDRQCIREESYVSTNVDVDSLPRSRDFSQRSLSPSASIYSSVDSPVSSPIGVPRSGNSGSKEANSESFGVGHRSNTDAFVSERNQNLRKEMDAHSILRDHCVRLNMYVVEPSSGLTSPALSVRSEVVVLSPPVCVSAHPQMDNDDHCDDKRVVAAQAVGFIGNSARLVGDGTSGDAQHDNHYSDASSDHHSREDGHKGEHHDNHYSDASSDHHSRDDEHKGEHHDNHYSDASSDHHSREDEHKGEHHDNHYSDASSDHHSREDGHKGEHHRHGRLPPPGHPHSESSSRSGGSTSTSSYHVPNLHTPHPHYEHRYLHYHVVPHHDRPAEDVWHPQDHHHHGFDDLSVDRYDEGAKSSDFVELKHAYLEFQDKIEHNYKF
jgi:hypothetical protein